VRSRLSLIGGVLVGLLLVPVCIAECGEVAVLESGAARQHTRIWVVDIDGVAYIRGNSNGSWVPRVREHPEMRLRRAGSWRSYRAIPVEGDAARVHGAMRAKYGFSERLRDELRGVASSTVFRLEPADPPTPSTRSGKH
jgi:hypothetical protein